MEEHSILIYNNGGVSTIGASQTLWVIQLSRFYNLMGVTTDLFRSYHYEVLGHDAYHPAMYIHLIYVSTFSFFAVVVIINLKERIKVNLLQIDSHYG